MKAVIMAGGEGTRLRPLTCNLPKPMVPILNRPMMEHILNLLKRHGFTDIASTLWYLPEHVERYFQNGDAFGVNMEYFVEREPLGTAGSVKNAVQFLQDTFIVMSGDALTDIDLTSAVEFHKKQGSMATLVLTRVPNPLSYGVVLVDESGKITQFLEKPSWSQVFSDTVNTGIYILEPEVLDLIKLGQKVDFSQDVFPELLRRGAPLYGYVAPGYWSDIGNLEVYSKAQVDSLNGAVKLELPANRKENILFEEDVYIHPDAQISGPVYLGKNCKIDAGAVIEPYTVIGSHCQVDARANIKRSLLWSGVRIGAGSQLRSCICSNNVQVERNIQIYEGAVLGERVKVGAFSMIGADTKIWPQKIIPSGTTLKKSLIWGSQSRPSLFTKHGISGDSRGDLTLETIIQVGLSYAAFLGTDKSILVTSDYSNLGDLVKTALIVGLRAGGLDVYDGGAVTGRVTRFSVQKLALDGALHCMQDHNENYNLVIECWNEKGRFLSKNDQRKIEGILEREDYPRLDSTDLGDFHKVYNLEDKYLELLAGQYSAKRKDYKVGLLLNSNQNPFGEMINKFLHLGGYDVVNKALEGIPTLVVQENDWFFQDEEGNTLTEEGWWGLFIHALKDRKRRDVALPVHVSRIVAQTAKEQGLNVHWTRGEPLFWMEMASELGNIQKEEKLDVIPYIEPLATIGELLSFLSSQNRSLSEFQTTTHKRKAKVLIPWDKKGRVMRELIEDSDSERTLYLDGIKEHSPSGWTLVVPDGDDPFFHLYSEADTMEEATRLIEDYTNKIKSYENEER